LRILCFLFLFAEMRVPAPQARNSSFIPAPDDRGMQFPRRALLATPLLLASAWPAAAAMLQPGVATGLNFVPLPRERVALRAEHLGCVSVPALRSRVLALLPVAARQMVVLAFGADPPGTQGHLDLAAFIGWDGAYLRVLALEVLTWHSAMGAVLDTRIAANPERTGVVLHRDTAAPLGATLWQREHWIDRLSWRERAPLADTPTRPPLPGTAQAQLALPRAAVAARLLAPCQTVADDLLGLFSPPALPPA
jgi:hypothetical protein